MSLSHHYSRREFLRSASAATLAVLAAGYPRRLLAKEGEEKLIPTADTVIVLWMAGFLNWDTHEHGHEKAANMKQAIDAPVAQLVLDLEERGLLNRTLIVLASEFSRDSLVEGKPDKKVKDQVPVPDKIEDLKNYGMHRHFTDAGCVLLFGGGVKKGYLHGVTADERPCRTLEKRVVIEDLHASIYRAMGISPRLAYEIERRPFYVTRDGLGKPIGDLFR